MRALTGRDEIAFDQPANGPHGRLAALAGSVGKGDEAAILALTLPEWEDLLLGLRRDLIGPRIESETDCPRCGAGNALVFAVDDLPRDPALPLALDGVALNTPRLGDLVALERRGLRGEPALAALLALVAGLSPDQAQARLSAPDRDSVVAALESAVAGLGLDIGTACSDCGAEIILPLNVADFLDAELRARAARLLDEIHLIASSYHWPESKILDLPFARRQDYLRRILAAQTLVEAG